jgi:hypothetical protein
MPQIMKQLYLLLILGCSLIACDPPISTDEYSEGYTGYGKTSLAATDSTLFVFHNIALDAYRLNLPATQPTRIYTKTRAIANAVDSLFFLNSLTLFAQSERGADGIFNVSQPSDIASVQASPVDPGACTQSFITGSYLIVVGLNTDGCYTQTGIVVHDFRTPDGASVSSLLTGNIQSAAIAASALYVSDSVLNVVDISRPEAIKTASVLRDSTVYTSLVVNGHLLSGRRPHAIDTYDITNPLQPVLVSKLFD